MAETVESGDAHPGQSGFLVPCDPTEFGDFLMGLLRAPKTLAFGRKIEFIISSKEFTDFHALLIDRISEQHEFALVSLIATLSYSDGRTYVYRDISDLEHHRELSGADCIRASLGWTFLVSLPNESVPQKQIVELNFSVGQAKAANGSFAIMFDGDDDLLFRRRAYVGFTVEHTHVTFGNDIGNLLRERVEALQTPDKFGDFLRKKYIRVLWHAVFMAGAVGVFGFVFSLDGGSPGLFSPEFETLEQYLRSSYFHLKTGFVSIAGFFMMILGVVLASVIFDSLSRRKPSFIVFDAEKKAAAEVEMKKFEKRPALAVLSVLGALLTGVAGSLVASGIWTQLPW